MAPSYTLKVKNMTGGPQNYAFFAKAPVVSGDTSGEIWGNILKAHPDTPNGGEAELKIWKDYYATCGSFAGKPEQGSQISANKNVPVVLGTNRDGDIVKGSSVALSVANSETPNLDAAKNPGEGKLANFELVTPANFTIKEAINNFIMVGISNSENGKSFQTLGSFTPYPNSKYQIEPLAIFYVAAGMKFQAGQLVKAEQIGKSMSVDFKARVANNVVLVHGENGQYTFE